jgi:hypothetical protein
MLISEFARTAGLTPDTVRFYVKRGLLKRLLAKRADRIPIKYSRTNTCRWRERFPWRSRWGFRSARSPP